MKRATVADRESRDVKGESRRELNRTAGICNCKNVCCSRWVPAGIADGGVGVGAAICAVVPLSTVAFWAEVGESLKLQFVGVNQLLSGFGPIQISSCAYKADDPAKRNFSVIATDKHLPHSEPILNSVEHFTIRPC
jgi:hypothetical protein